MSKMKIWQVPGFQILADSQNTTALWGANSLSIRNITTEERLQHLCNIWFVDLLRTIACKIILDMATGKAIRRHMTDW